MSINLTHEVKEVELIIKHLAMGAYGEVAELIQKIREQAIPQVAAQQAQGQTTTVVTNAENAVEANPQTQVDIDEAQANSDSMKNE